MPTDFIGLFAMLAAAKVRFVLVGGLALVLHGLDRLTADVDLVIDLSGDSARAAVEAGHGEASIHCEFCGREYRFNGEAVGIMFRDAAAELPAAPGIQ